MSNVIYPPYCTICKKINMNPKKNESFADFHNNTPISGIVLDIGAVFFCKDPSMYSNSDVTAIITDINIPHWEDHTRSYKMLVYIHDAMGLPYIFYQEGDTYKSNLYETGLYPRNYDTLRELTENEFHTFIERVNNPESGGSYLCKIIEEYKGKSLHRGIFKI